MTDDKKPNQEEETDESQPNQEEEPATPNLEDEALGAAGKSPEAKPDQNSRWDSLEDVPESVRDQVKSYTSRAVNHALEKAKSNPNPAPKDSGVTPEQLEAALAKQRQEFEAQRAEDQRLADLRTQTTQRMRGVFEKHGIQPGSDRHKAVTKFYDEQRKAGVLDATVLLTEAGLNGLIIAAGAERADRETSRGPGSGSRQLSADGFGPISGEGDEPTKEETAMEAKFARLRKKAGI